MNRSKTVGNSGNCTECFTIVDEPIHLGSHSFDGSLILFDHHCSTVISEQLGVQRLMILCCVLPRHDDARNTHH